MNKIKSERIRLGLTQHQLSDLTGIPFRTIQNWEGGQRKCPDYVERLVLEKLDRMNDPDRECGMWIFKRTYYEADECNCSICGQLMTTANGKRMNYCPNCGAKMDK